MKLQKYKTQRSSISIIKVYVQLQLTQHKNKTEIASKCIKTQRYKTVQ